MKILKQVGAAVLFLFEILKCMFHRPCSRRELFDQIWKVSEQSLATTAMAGFFVGAIMCVQFSIQLAEFGALGFLGGLSTSATVREVGPLLIAFMLAGKIGAFTSAELGTMRVTEQIDAIRCLGADPIQEIILPRFLAIIIASFLLLSIGLLTSVFGGIVVAGLIAGVNPEEYLRHVPTILNMASILSGGFKCFFFSLLLATLCCYKGYHTTGGAKGVGLSVVNTAVATMVGIVLVDWLTSYLSEMGLKAMGIY